MIISVAEYVKDNEVRKVVLRSDKIRNMTLEKCYSIPGYDDLPRKVQNAVYDNVRLMIEKAIENEDKNVSGIDNNNKGGKQKCGTRSHIRHRQTPTASEA